MRYDFSNTADLAERVGPSGPPIFQGGTMGINDIMLKHSGVDLFHVKGFKGQAMTGMVLENIPSNDGHEVAVKKSALESAPLANILIRQNEPKSWQEAIDSLHPDFKGDRIRVVNISMTGFSFDLSRQYVALGGVVVCATGNRVTSETSGWDHVIDIGRVYEGDFRKASESASSETLDLVSFNPYIQNLDGNWFQPNGTSFASPFVMGIVLCLLQYWDHIGYRGNVRDYLIKHAVDINEIGKDRQTGHGYVKVDFMNVIRLEIGGKAYINDIENPIDVPAQIINGRTLVPLRFVSEHLGCEVSFKTDENKKVTEVTVIQDTIT